MSDGRLRVAAALLLTSPFVPMLFQGEEWGATHAVPVLHRPPDPELAGPSAKGGAANSPRSAGIRTTCPIRRHPATFERSRLDWAEPRKDQHADLLGWYRRLIALRRQIPALTDPRLDRIDTECDEGAGWLVVRRGPVVVASNIGVGAWTFPASQFPVLLAASDPRVESTPQGVILPPDSVVILTKAGMP